MFRIEVVSTKVDTFQHEEPTQQFRWRCSNCNHTTLSIISEKTLQAFSEIDDAFCTRDCSWCKAPSVIRLKVHREEIDKFINNK